MKPWWVGRTGLPKVGQSDGPTESSFSVGDAIMLIFFSSVFFVVLGYFSGNVLVDRLKLTDAFRSLRRSRPWQLHMDRSRQLAQRLFP